MAIRGPRLEFAVGAFLVLTLASLLVLALASTNGRFDLGGGTYPLKARFTNIGQLRLAAPVKIGGVTIGRVAKIDLDPVKLDSVLTLDIDDRYKDLPGDTSAGILTAGLLGEQYIGITAGYEAQDLKAGDRISSTQSAVVLENLISQFLFSKAAEGGDKISDNAPEKTDTAGKE